jgi:hypothetical protein
MEKNLIKLRVCNLDSPARVRAVPGEPKRELVMIIQPFDGLNA